MGWDDKTPLVATASPGDAAMGRIRICVDSEGHIDRANRADFDICLTTTEAPAPWVRVPDPKGAASALTACAAANPVAAAIACQTLRAAEGLAFDQALVVESLAYSTLLAGAEFKRWRAGTRTNPQTDIAAHVRYDRSPDDVVTLTLSDPASLNAYSNAMRDALIERLDTCLDDPTGPAVVLRGEGRAFCTGGLLSEFGLSADMARAHIDRLAASATARIRRLGPRATAIVQGAAIGSGIEMAAAAHRLVASPGAWFQLPELGMGLIPGAGGMASIPARIGRHRTCYLILSGHRLSSGKARGWGLVDEVRDA